MNEKTLTWQTQQTRREPQHDHRDHGAREREGCAAVGEAPRSRARPAPDVFPLLRRSTSNPHVMLISNMADAPGPCTTPLYLPL